jgi:hypothetical protein
MKKLSVAISLDFWGWGSVSVIDYFELHNELFCSVKGGEFTKLLKDSAAWGLVLMLVVYIYIQPNTEIPFLVLENNE